MSILTLTEQAAPPAAPAANKARVFLDASGILCTRDDTGRIAAWSGNAAIAAQGAGFAADTYVTNSDILIPAFQLQAKSRIVWTISASKTAAGVAAPAYSIRIGALRTIVDTARLVLNGPAQTAIADIGVLVIALTVRSVGVAGVIQGTAAWLHRGTVASSTGGTGFANDDGGVVEGTSAGFDTTALGGQYIGLSINGGAAAAWTLTQVLAEASW
jgi:hypothetical protein